MPYRVLATEILDDTDRVVFDALDNKRIRRELCKWMNKAESAEARAAQAESELDNSGSAYVAMAYKVAELQRVVSEVVAERDEARMELQQIRTMLDNGTDETAIEMVKRLNAELYDSRQEYAHDPRVPIEIRDPRWSDDGT